MSDLTVEEFTSEAPYTVNQNETLKHAMDLMKTHEIRHLPVTVGEEVVGVISERDLLANFGKPWAEQLRVKEIMNSSILTVHKDAPLGEVAFRLAKEKKGSAIVLDSDENLYGIFTTTDALNALVEILMPEGSGRHFRLA